MSLRVIIPPTAEPILLAEARLHLRVGDPDDSPMPTHPDDGLILSLITAAREHAEAFTGLAIGLAAYEQRVDDLCEVMDLGQSPISAIVSITYIDADGVTQTASSSLYELDDDITNPAVRLAFDQEWPDVRGDINGVRIRFMAGYTDGESPNPFPIPKTIKQAMLLMIGFWYENREDLILDEMPTASIALLRPHRIRTGMA